MNMDHGDQALEMSAGVLSPQSSVDLTSRDRAVVTEELERKLKTRAERQDLVQRNILPDFPHPVAPKLFTHTRELQRVKLVDNLQKKLRNRADPNHLVSMNILPDQPNIDPSLQGKMKELRNRRLADTLNDKLANRPGPLVLVRDHILEPNLGKMVKELNSQSTDLLSSSTGEQTTPPESHSSRLPAISVADGTSGGQRALPTHRHSYAGGIPSPRQFQMDTSSPSKELASPMNSGCSEASSGGFGRKLSDSSISPAPSPGDGFEEVHSPIKSPQDQSPRGLTSSYPPVTCSGDLPRAVQTPGIMSSSIGKAPSPSQNRKKAQKQQKYRKLRYHEYVPPSKSNGKGGKTTPKPLPKSDSPYALLLQQQQLFLQLQVYQEKYPNGLIMQKLPDLINSLSKDEKGQSLVSKGRVPVTSPASDSSRGSRLITSVPQVLQVEQPNKHNLSTIRFDDLKVSDLKAACKELGMIVSGKKAELVERLLDHNKGLLPAIALPDNSAKDSKRHSFSASHASSLDSQPPSTVSPASPSSPIFQFPSDKQTGGVGVAGGAGSGGQLSSSASGTSKPPLSRLGHHSESMPSIGLPEVLPGANFQLEFDELMERQKRNYFTNQKLGSKSLAPRPDINDLMAIRFPPAYSSSQQQQQHGASSSTMSSGGHHHSAGSRGKGSTLPHHMDAKQMMLIGGEKNSRSLPSSPQPHSPDHILELMDNSDNSSSLIASSIATSSSAAASVGGVVGGASFQVSKSVSLLGNQSEQQQRQQQQQQDIENILMESVSAFLPLDDVAPPLTTTSTIGVSTSMAYHSPSHTQLQQQQQQQNKQHNIMRPSRSSVPIHPVHAKVHPMNPPSYSSHQMMQRSQSISGPIPAAPSHLQQVVQQRMHSGASYSSDMSDIVGTPAATVNELGKTTTPDGVLMSDGSISHTDIVDMPMETGDGGFPDFMDNLMFRADGPDYAVHGQPSSLPAHAHSHLPPPPPHTFGTPTKYGNRQDLIQSDSFAMPFGNPSFGLQGKTPSDICLNLEGHRNSTGGVVPGGNVMLAEQDLGWLDLDSHQGTINFSPTIGSGFPSNLNRHSNPGSLQHDQFHMSFLDDPQVVTTSSGGAVMRSSNPALNGFVDVPTTVGFLESGGVSHQSGLFPELLSS